MYDFDLGANTDVGVRVPCQHAVVKASRAEFSPELAAPAIAVDRPRDSPLTGRCTHILRARHADPTRTRVLSLVAQGHSNAAIANNLVLSERTVMAHMDAVFAKLGLIVDGTTHRRVLAVVTYLETRQTGPDRRCRHSGRSAAGYLDVITVLADPRASAALLEVRHTAAIVGVDDAVCRSGRRMLGAPRPSDLAPVGRLLMEHEQHLVVRAHWSRDVRAGQHVGEWQGSDRRCWQAP
jgi:hypothetical protein